MDGTRRQRGAVDAPSDELKHSRLKVIRGGSARPQQLRAMLVRLGPIFVKIGQFLALRPDILPQEYCDELMQLVDQSPPEPWEKIYAILEGELGEKPERRFRMIRR